MPDLKFAACILLVTCLWPAAVDAQSSQKAAYLEYVRTAAEEGERGHEALVAAWKQNVDPSVLWGYNPPGTPLYLADLHAFLYQHTGDQEYARRAARLLAEYGDLREAFPEDFVRARVEYESGLPALSNFFFLPPYSRAYSLIAESGVLDPATRAKIEETLAHSLDFVFHFPEWGAHNRAMLRAEGLYYGALALPDHPHAPRWKQMARTIAVDNLNQWEAEDATIYHPVWLQSLMSYAEIAGREDIYDLPYLRYYAEYFKRQFTPLRTMPDYGDANWDPSWYFFIPPLEKLAARYQDAELKWVVEALFDRAWEDYPVPGVMAASSIAMAHRWTDDTLVPRRPASGSQELLDDVIGKKVVFRDGWAPESTYLILNYRDEGEGSFATREFLRNTITVEEEKMHHGHSDENSVVLLVDRGSVLLHDAGYRDDLPSGPFGAYRSDYFHNRLVIRKDKRDRYQSVPDFIRTSGAYRPVRTQKIEFLTFDDVEMSRTRLHDDLLGYAWDRIITYLKPQGVFLVVDAVEVKETDYYTFTNLWHTQTLHAQGPHYYDTSIDSIGAVKLPAGRRLLVQFLENYAKEDSFYVGNRHFQEEKSIYQTKSSHYRAGDWEVFVTALIPHDAGAPVEPLLDEIRLLPVDRFPKAVGFEIRSGDRRSYLGLKLDLESEVVRENIRPRYTWEAGRTTYGPIETDAHFVYATVDGNRVSYAASQVLKVLFNGNTLMEALPNTHGLQPDGAPDRIGYVKWRFWEDDITVDGR